MAKPRKKTSIPLRLLIIGDSEKDARLLLKELRKGGYNPVFKRVKAAQTLKSALSKEAWDVVVADYSLRRFSGLEALRLIKKNDYDLPVIIISNKGSEKAAVECIKAGAHDYIRRNRLFMLVNIIKHAMREVDLSRLEKKAEMELEESRELLENIFSNIHFLVAYMDTDFNFIRVNHAYAKHGRHDPDFFIGKNHFDLYPNEENEKIFRKVVETGEPYTTFERPFEYPDQPERGVTYWDWTLQPLKDERGKVDSLILSLVDVTSRKTAEMERIRLAAALENASEGVMITDKQAIIKYANPAFLRTCGYTKEELVGKSAYLLMGDKHDEEFYKPIRDVIRRGEVWRGKITRKKKDSTLYDVEMTLSPIPDSKGIVTHYVIIERDITDEIRLQQHLRQTQKMEALGTLAGGIAHDFNNILMPVIINTELALWEIPENSPVQSYLKLALEVADRGKDLVKQIISFSRPSKQKRRPIKIAPAIKESLDFLKATLPSSIKICPDIRAEESIVLADPVQIEQVLINLCNNAAYAMKEKGGMLKVSLDEVDMDSKTLARYPGLNSGACLQLTVSDSGCGIPQDIIEHIFNPFFTTKNPGEGTGLGLAIVHGIVESHGGAISLRSEVGKGTTFNVFLPRIEGEIREKEDLSWQIPKGEERILLVEDEESVLLSLQNVLKYLGYRITAVKDSREALRIFYDKPDSFDLVLTDQTMPDMLGSDLAKEVISIRPDMPVILCTGFSNEISRDEAIKIGIRDYVVKPINTRKIAQLIRRIFDGKD